MSYKNPGLQIPDIEKVQGDEGCIYLRSRMPLADFTENLGSWLYYWAERAPDRCFIGEKDAKGVWQRISYARALQDAEVIAQSLLDQGLSAQRPLMVLSGNSLNFARLQLAALLAAIPMVPVSPAYSLMSQDFAKLKHCVQLTTPGLIYVESAAPFAAALQQLTNTGAKFYATETGSQAGVS